MSSLDEQILGFLTQARSGSGNRFNQPSLFSELELLSLPLLRNLSEKRDFSVVQTFNRSLKGHERKRLMAIQSPQDLFFYDLCSMYDVELKLAQVLPILAQESQNAQLSEALLEHQQETVQHARNLEQCFQILGREPVKVENRAVLGLREDHDLFKQENPSPQVLTMFDVEAASKSEYMEMAAYRGLIDAARLLGYQQCVPLFEQNLKQEEAAAQKLATIAQQIGQAQKRVA